MEAIRPEVAPTVDAPSIDHDHVKLLLSYTDFTNTPKGLADAYQDTASAEESSTERLFLDAGGFSAWFVYFLAKRAAKTSIHFRGQAACVQLLTAVGRTSVESRRQLAQAVQKAIAPATQVKFQDVFDRVIKTGHPQKRRRLASENDNPMIASIPDPITTVSDAHLYNTCQNAALFDLVNPPILRVITALPVYIAGAIRKLQHDGTWLAAITMSFLDASSFGHKMGCMMSLEITNNKVERLARELFDAHIEVAGEHRYLTLPSSLRVIPNPDLILRGCKRHVLLEWFGGDIDQAIRSTPAFKEEAEQGNPLTECVSMTVSHRATDSAVINLTLDEKEGFRIRRILYE